MIPQGPKKQIVIVEEPQTKIIMSAKETIKIPVTKTKTEIVKEIVNTQTQEFFDKKASLTNLRVEKEHQLVMKNRQVELTKAEVERAREHAIRLEEEYTQLLHEQEEFQKEYDEVDDEFQTVNNQPTTEVIERAIESTFTEYIEKKVRRKTIETPIANPDWEQ